MFDCMSTKFNTLISLADESHIPHAVPIAHADRVNTRVPCHENSLFANNTLGKRYVGTFETAIDDFTP